MSKTITVRLENETYDLFKKAATGERRTISNFLEWATLSYVSNELFVDDEEMTEIRQNSSSLRKGLEEARKGKYTLVK
ncbi:MAG: CopG family transcriptional regulator [Fibrobacterota bacterium]